MIGIYTNILLRYITQDDTKQTLKASKLIEDALNSNETLWINLLTLCEVVWVLERTYKLNKSEITSIVQMLTETKNCKIANEEIVLKGLQDYIVSKQVGFSDCLIGRVNESSECQVTSTFDKKAAKSLPTFKLVT